MQDCEWVFLCKMTECIQFVFLEPCLQCISDRSFGQEAISREHEVLLFMSVK